MDGSAKSPEEIRYDDQFGELSASDIGRDPELKVL